jgi:hypothetical protein
MIAPIGHYPSTTNETQPGAAVLAVIDHDSTWYCRTLDETDELARAEFVKRYRRQPQIVSRDHNLVFCGPLTEQEVAKNATREPQP